MNLITKKIVTYIYRRITEFSTWRGLILLATGTWGVNNPQAVDTIIYYSFMAVGFIATVLPDRIESLYFLKEFNIKPPQERADDEPTFDPNNSSS